MSDSTEKKTSPPADESDPGFVIDRNVVTLGRIRAENAEGRSREDKFADLITRFSGSMKFLYLHMVWFCIWIVWNTGMFGLHPFDPFPYGLLTMVVSLEAIFLSTIVMISQNRISAQSEEQASLDLEINLLAEHEITRLLRLTEAIARKLEIDDACTEDLKELEQDIEPTSIIHKLREEFRNPSAPKE